MEYYNTTAHLYSQQYSNEQTKKYIVALDSVKIIKNDYILDVGCGIGLFIKEISELAGFIVGIDISIKMIEVAKEKCKNLRNVHLIYGDADYLPLQKKIVDKIFSFTLLQNMPEVQKIIKGILRIAKSDSKIILTFNKKVFRSETIKNLINKLNLEITNFIDNEDLKDYLMISIMS